MAKSGQRRVDKRDKPIKSSGGHAPCAFPSVGFKQPTVVSWGLWVEGGRVTRRKEPGYPNRCLEESTPVWMGAHSLDLDCTEPLRFGHLPVSLIYQFQGLLLARVRNLDSVWMKQETLWDFLSSFFWASSPAGSHFRAGKHRR